MRVLVISLLRIGDFLQTVPALTGMKTQFQVKKIDVLTFAQVKALQPMVADVDNWWTLDRDELQAGLGRGDLPLLTSYSVLKEKLDEVSAADYDCVINLTHTRFSGWVSGYIQSRRRIGLAMDGNGSAMFHSPWFQYLDDHADRPGRDIFHYTDIFFHGCGLKGAERIWNLRETKRGRAEIKDIAGEEIIAIQPLTSDTKKNWGAERWADMMTRFQLLRPKVRFALLCAPNEADAVDEIVKMSIARGVRADKAMLSLEGAFSLLKRSRLLITGDTSIKHLAHAANIRILELSLGSSDWRRTGVYRKDSLILQPRVPCVPCPHSNACLRPSHECAEQLSPELVAASAHHFLGDNWMVLKQLAHEYLKEAALLRTFNTAAGFWMAADLSEARPDVILESLVERSTWTFLLNQEHRTQLPQFGSEGVRMRNELSRLLPREPTFELHRHLGFIEAEAGRRKSEMENHLREMKRPGRLQGVAEIGELRRESSRIETSLKQAEIKIKLIHALKSQMTEKA